MYFLDEAIAEAAQQDALDMPVGIASAHEPILEPIFLPMRARDYNADTESPPLDPEGTALMDPITVVPDDTPEPPPGPYRDSITLEPGAGTKVPDPYRTPRRDVTKDEGDIL